MKPKKFIEQDAFANYVANHYIYIRDILKPIKFSTEIKIETKSETVTKYPEISYRISSVARNGNHIFAEYKEESPRKHYKDDEEYNLEEQTQKYISKINKIITDKGIRTKISKLIIEIEETPKSISTSNT